MLLTYRVAIACNLRRHNFGCCVLNKKGKEVDEVYVVQPPTGSRDSFVAMNLRGKVPFGIADENDPQLEAFK